MLGRAPSPTRRRRTSRRRPAGVGTPASEHIPSVGNRIEDDIKKYQDRRVRFRHYSLPNTEALARPNVFGSAPEDAQPPRPPGRLLRLLPGRLSLRGPVPVLHPFRRLRCLFRSLWRVLWGLKLWRTPMAGKERSGQLPCYAPSTPGSPLAAPRATVYNADRYPVPHLTRTHFSLRGTGPSLPPEDEAKPPRPPRPPCAPLRPRPALLGFGAARGSRDRLGGVSWISWGF